MRATWYALLTQRDFTPLELLDEEDTSKEAAEVRAVLLNPGKFRKQPAAAVRPGDAAGVQGPAKTVAPEPLQRSLQPQLTVEGEKPQEQVFEINDNEPL